MTWIMVIILGYYEGVGIQKVEIPFHTREQCEQSVESMRPLDNASWVAVCTPGG
jgi:cell division protein FtsN